MRKYFIVLNWFLLVSLAGIVTVYAYFEGTPLIGVVRYEPNADINTNNLRNDPPSKTFFAIQDHIYEGQLYINLGESILTNYVCGISPHWELQDGNTPNPDHTFFDGPRVDYLTALGDVGNLQDGYIGTLGNFSKSFMGISSWSDVKVSFISGTQYGNVWFTSTEESPYINNDFSRMSDLEWRYRVLRDWASNGSSDSVWIYVTRQYSYTMLINDGSLEGSNLWGALPSGTGEVSLGEIETKGYAEINLFKWNTDESVDALGKLYIYSNGDVFLNTNPVLITVTSPNGGEELFSGEIFDIAWTSEGEIGNVQIEYSDNDGVGWTEIVASTENDGSFYWDVPCDLSDDSLIKISDVDSDASDTSDAVFFIVDIDSDGVCGDIDNCPEDYNPEQLDYDEDGIGDVCDVDADDDGFTFDNDCDDLDSSINPDACDIKKDGIDQDCDGFDRTRGRPCPSGGDNGEPSSKEGPAQTCNDGIDNDDDGYTDCDDSDCAKKKNCRI